MSAVPEQLFDRLHAVEHKALRNELNLTSHEEKCSLRYEALWVEVRNANRNIRWAAVTLLGGMAAILAKLVFFS